VERTSSLAELLASAVEHHDAGRIDAASAGFSRVLALDPGQGQAWRRLAIIAFRKNDRGLARELLERALSVDARDATAHRLLGAVDECDGRLEAAHVAYAASCAIDPAQDAARIGLARVALALGRGAEAIATAQAAATRGIVDAGLLRTLGAARALQHDYSGAIDAFAAALRLEPHPGAFANLAGALLQLERVDAALDAVRGALAIDPAHAPATLHLGVARLAQGAFAEAAVTFERAVTLGCEEARINLGRLRLLMGDAENAWAHFGCDDAARRALPVYAALPMWDGVHAPARRLLVWHEQGVGDTFAMARFLRAARERVAQVTLACPAATMELLRSVAGVDAVVDLHAPIAFGAFDVWLPTTRLPVVAAARLDRLPAAPYLRADPQRVRRLRGQLDAPGLRVGLVWSGNPRFARNAERSCGLERLGALNAVEGITWFALQQGAAKREQPTGGMQLVLINAGVRDYADTAAIIAQLDLVITVDTSVANLAGALGRPAWVLLMKTPDWRWGLVGQTSVWYPSLRLFRQRDTGDWTAVIAEVADALRAFVHGH
jgi:tetratricopeptide (TPR) repeat protein